MLKVVHDTEKDATSPARARDGWVQGKNGGWLRPIAKGDKRRAGYRKPHALTEVLQAARRASPQAIDTLVQALGHPDGRVAVTAASLLLDRAWGRPREMKPEEQQQAAKIDLSKLSNAELRILLELAQSGRLVAAPDGPEGEPVIEGAVG